DSGAPEGACLHELFEAWARRTPDSPAVVGEDGVLTWRELDRWANGLAHDLRGLEVGPESRVALCAERSAAMVAGLLAILKAGAAYVPLDPSYPRERLVDLLEDCGAAALVAHRHLAELLEDAGLPAVLLDGDRPVAATPPPAGAFPESPAYVIYTSGSTGRSKGVVVEHRQAVNYLRGAAVRLELEELPPGMAYATVSTLAADLGNTVVFASLALGGVLHVIPRERVADADGLGDWFEEHGIDVLKIVPSHLAALLSGARPERVLPRRRLILGGERSESAWVEGLRELAPGCRIFNHYGPTETTVGVIAGRAAAGSGSLPLGRPLAGSRILLLDRDLRPVPAGVPGGLYVAGAGLARGYLGRPDLTAERFVPNPLGTEPGERLYRAGDLARALPDGRVEFLGRLDDQVKIRGYRVEPGEVEAALAALPGVREAAVLARMSASGAPRLVAWVVPAGPGATAPELRAALARTLPEALVPAAFVLLEALPLTPNGKLDRRALPAAPEETEGPVVEGAGPRTALEELLAAYWAELLGRDRVGVHDDFFDLGGHSLLATRAISRARAIAGWTVPLHALFEARTVAGLARWIERSRGAPAAPPLAPAADGSPAPLSFAQERLWFLDQLEPGSALYNLPYFARVEGPLDAAALERALGAAARRHEALRTVFPVHQGTPVQEVLPPAGLPLPAIDLSGLAPERREAEARRLAEAEARRPFDLERGPLARAALVRLGAEDHLLLLTLHHIISDAWSRTVLIRELQALYSGSPLPRLPVQYGDFARWQRGWLRGESLDARLAWWRERLEGAPTALQLPWDRPLSGGQRWTGTTVPFALPPDLAGVLEERARREGVTLFMLLLGVLQVLLHRVSGQDDVVVGTAIAGRDRSELEGLVGFFVNALPLRARFADEPKLAGHLAAVRATALGAYAHQDLPFEKLVEALGADRAAGLPPVFQVVFTLQNVPESATALGGAALRPLEVHTGTAKFPLTLALAPAGGGLAGAAELAAELFDSATVERLLGSFRVALEAVASGAGGRVGDLPLLGEAERRQLLLDTALTLPVNLDLLDLFENQADARLDTVAVVCGDERLTWSELDRRANRLAHHLIALGVGPDVAVGLALERSVDLVVAILATVKAGGFYVPLDLSAPQERLELLAAQAGVRIALANDEETEIRLAGTGALILDPADWLEAAGPEHRPQRRALGANLLYVMYTSGSTGQPKGVAVTRANVLRLVWDTDYCRFAPDEVFLLLAPAAFDASTFELWGALSSGARLAVMPGGAFTLHELERAVQGHGVTTLWLTAGLFHQVVDERPAILRPLRQLLAGGDVLSPEHVRRALEAAPDCRLINGYGPTEGTTFTTCHAVERGRDLTTVPIGRPIARTSVRVLDRYGASVPDGIPGELHAGGHGLARGYLGRPDLTAERFVPDPFGGSGERLYRTGDLVRRRRGGEIEFLGRLDGQVKLRGFRIEPGEIETALAKHPAVREAVVLAREDRPGDRRLVAWVVTEEAAPAADELRAFLRDRLPAYMVPSAFVALDALPLTPNGKVNRRVLPAPVDSPGEAQAAAPRTPMEELVAGLFADVLGVREVGAGDDFFALGGHSLLATRLLARVRETLGAEVPLRDLFEAPTVEAFAARVDAARASEHGEPEPPSPRPDRGDAPLSFAQQRLWFLDQLEPGSPLYNVAFVVRAHGPLRPEVLEASLAEMVRRHDALRTTFPQTEEGPRQAVLPAAGLRLPVVDLSGLGKRQSAAEALRLARAEAMRPFNLAWGPLLRALLLRLGAGRHWLVTAVHHIVFDGWSIGVLTGEMAALYAALEEGRPARLPELPLQYADFAAWQRRCLEGERLEAQATWWRGQLAGSAPAELPADRPRPAVRDLRGAALSTSLSRRETAALHDLARRRGATPFMVLLTALQALVRRHGGPRDAAVGSPIAGRRYRELEGMIGFFVNTLVLCQELREDASFGS
ncbi:MAG TPA: amino acid adenylation domain-containing protein, partial [Thermoanaerobaculia bacterium]|nr:amino acid adenylation domain-containing protein [Thermoanaerobaculia bacterium]